MPLTIRYLGAVAGLVLVLLQTAYAQESGVNKAAAPAAKSEAAKTMKSAKSPAERSAAAKTLSATSPATKKKGKSASAAT